VGKGPSSGNSVVSAGLFVPNGRRSAILEPDGKKPKIKGYNRTSQKALHWKIILML
jgi:hypothetical protein